jgi:DNA gyrase subunit A
MQEEKIIKINIEEEMKSAYIDYSMSVIVSRALPDVRDGLKPVHRRVLFGMSELGNLSNKPHKKSARIVGEVLGKYHPHGDSSVYDAMVRLGQPWSMRYMMVDGQGNFGSVDGDSPAAMRYTEARMSKMAEEMMADIEKNTVDFQPNFDDTLEEPTVMPCAFPNLIVNGTSGIAVGMATNMAPHNLRETIDAIVAYIDNNDITVDELMHHIKGPDFPTGAIIYGYQGVKEAYETGRGKIIVRSKTEVEVTPSGRDKIIVTEIPYQVNKAELIKRTADLINEKKIEGISYINDESDRNGMRIVIILKKEAKANVVLNNLFKHTQLQSSFNINNIALVHGRPQTLNLKQLIYHFVEHRHDVVIRRTKFDLDQAEKRKHILEGLLIAVDNIDEVVRIIRAAVNSEEAQNKLIERFNLSEIQARAILDMRLRALTGLSRDELHKEYEELLKTIEYLNQVLADESLRMKIIKDELLVIKEKYGDERRTEIIPTAEEFNPEDFFANDDMVLTISNLGYIKRTPLTEFKTQSRGGVGTKGSSTRDEDFLVHMHNATMHNTMLFFTEKGKCFWHKVYEIPEGSKTSKGRAIQNLINIDQDDSVKAYINVKSLTDQEYVKGHYIVLCTRKGVMKKMELADFTRPRQNGIVAITVRDGDSLMDAKLTDGESNILVAIRSGRAIRFPENKVRAMGRTAAGVRAITLSEKEGDQVVGIVCVDNQNQNILVVSENGYGKRSDIEDYRITNRGGKGVKTINITEKTGMLIAVKGVTDQEDLMIINKSGITIRLAVSDIRLIGRNAQGVKLINLRKNDVIASVAQVPKSEDESYETPVNGDSEPSDSIDQGNETTNE